MSVFTRIVRSIFVGITSRKPHYGPRSKQSPLPPSQYIRNYITVLLLTSFCRHNPHTSFRISINPPRKGPSFLLSSILFAMYSPLDSESDEIRIVHLHPAPSHSSPIQCSLHRVSLENNPEYTALSYTWGSPIKLPWWERIRSKKRTIWVDGVEVVVTANLASALEQLRTTDSDEWESLPPRKFWIDALSINQNDDDEKAQQVQKMRIIYERAKDTIVWLGPSRNGSDEALKFIDRAGHEDNTDNFSDPRLWKTIPGKELEALWGRTYWRRIWV